MCVGGGDERLRKRWHKLLNPQNKPALSTLLERRNPKVRRKIHIEYGATAPADRAPHLLR